MLVGTIDSSRPFTARSCWLGFGWMAGCPLLASRLDALSLEALPLITGSGGVVLMTRVVESSPVCVDRLVAATRWCLGSAGIRLPMASLPALPSIECVEEEFDEEKLRS